MKKLIASVLSLVFVLSLVGCNADRSVPNVPEKPQETQQTEAPTMQQEGQTAAVIAPLPVTVDITNLEDCTVAVSLEEGDFYTDETGTVRMDVTVFVYDLYDLVDISRGQEKVLISSIERTENGSVLINGGPDLGGFCLCAADNTVYYELGYSDTKSYYPLGKVSLPVSPDFICNDSSDLDKGAVSYRAEDFLAGTGTIDYLFNAHNTTIQIEAGLVTAMTRVYTP